MGRRSFGRHWAISARLSVAGILAAAAGGVAAPLTVSASPGSPAAAGALHVVVSGAPSAGAHEVEQAVGRVGGSVTRDLAVVNGVAATVPAASLGALRAQPGVAEVTPDLQVRMQTISAADYSPVQDMGSLFNTTLMTGAQAYWRAGYTGRGVDIAVIDSGVVPVDGLSAPGKVVNGPDLSFDSQSPNLAHLDAFGHGTHLAGIMAGRDGAAVSGAYAGDSADFIGMAPDARVISVKVADANGLSDVSQVLAAIDWVVLHRSDPGLNIRVLNLSFGTNSYQSYLYDPLSYAVEIAWRSGIVVTAATGNAGWKTGVLDPASNPYVIAVGASDPQGTTSYANDTVATFSSGGDGYRNPDLVAPGAHLVSLRDPNSFIDTMYPGGRVGTRFFRGSGTSQACAVVSGAAALVLSQHPGASPDQVKALLTSSATPLAGQPASMQGAGELNLSRTLRAPMPLLAAQLWLPSLGTGSIDGARGSVVLSDNGVALRGEADIFGNPLNTGILAQALRLGTVWVGGLFNGVLWTGEGWLGGSWSTATWTSPTFTGSQWSGSQWSGNQWSGSQWSGSQWSGSQWSGSQWSGSQWSGSQWSGSQWSGSQWSGSQWSTAGWS